jgi:hypothetical protein
MGWGHDKNRPQEQNSGCRRVAPWQEKQQGKERKEKKPVRREDEKRSRGQTGGDGPEQTR